VLFFEADTGRGQIRDVDQSHRPRLPEIAGEQGFEQMRVDPPQPGHAHATTEFMQDAHAGHLSLTAQTGELSPGALLRQQCDQQIHRMHRRQQRQQMDPIKLCRTVISPPSTGRAMRPAVVDEIVGDEGVQKVKQGRRAGRGKIGIHCSSLPVEI
jgi:hypothetical protein